MKDIVIKEKRIKTELLILLICFVTACIVNVFSIISYGTAWKELFTQLPVVVLLALVFYCLSFLARLAFKAVRLAFARKKSS